MPKVPFAGKTGKYTITPLLKPRNLFIIGLVSFFLTFPLIFVGLGGVAILSFLLGLIIVLVITPVQWIRFRLKGKKKASL